LRDDKPCIKRICRHVCITSCWEFLVHEIGNSRKWEWKHWVSCRPRRSLARSVVSANFDRRRRPVSPSVCVWACVGQVGRGSLTGRAAGQPQSELLLQQLAPISCNHDIAARRCLPNTTHHNTRHTSVHRWAASYYITSEIAAETTAHSSTWFSASGRVWHQHETVEMCTSCREIRSQYHNQKFIWGYFLPPFPPLSFLSFPLPTSSFPSLSPDATWASNPAKGFGER